jgi:tetratricopeptide (TPR) repeat protein
MARQKKPIGELRAEERGMIAWFRDRLSLPGLEVWSTNLRTILINVLFLLMLIVVLPVLFSQFNRDEVIIEPIAVPETLAAQGFSPEVAASRVWDGLRDVKAAARTSKETLVALPDARQVEFSFPDSGFSIESLVFHLRRLFNAYETRIAGEIVCADANCERAGMRLRLRVIRDDVELVDLPPIGAADERVYFADAAASVLAVLDPFVAIAADVADNPLRATVLARGLIRMRHPDAKWAHNLIGNIRADAGDYASAAAEYQAAIELDPGFLIARSNLGRSLIKINDLTAARAEFAEIQRRSPKNLFAERGLAELALAEGDKAAAVRHFLAAAGIDPQSPRHLADAGRIEMEAGREAEGVALLTRALEIDPGYLPAFAVLGAMHVGKGDYAAAEPIYRDAADYSPDDATAQAAHGDILGLLKLWDDALVRYRRAAALDPPSAWYRLQTGRALQRLGRHGEALAELEAALGFEPANPVTVMAMADAYRDLGRTGEAVEAYRKFLELDKESLMRPVAEQWIKLLSEKG